MVNTKKLKAKLRECGLTQDAAAKCLGMNPATFNRKINNSDGETLTVKEADMFSKMLFIPKEELADYFFYQETCGNAK